LSKNASTNQEYAVEEIEMKEKVDKHDEAIEAEETKKAAARAEISGFSKLLPYNQPKILIVTGIVSCLWNGVSQPLAGIAMAKLLSYLTIPV
jgi:hypothetical protein